MYDCWSDAETIEHFYKLNIKWSENKNFLQIGFLSRVHHSIISIISFAYETIPYMTNAWLILYSSFYIKWKSFNAVCTNLVKNVLWCIINQNRQ